MTVGELRAILAGLGDDEPVLLATTYQDEVGEDVHAELTGFSRRDAHNDGIYVEIELSMLDDLDFDDEDDWEEDEP